MFIKQGGWKIHESTLQGSAHSKEPSLPLNALPSHCIIITVKCVLSLRTPWSMRMAIKSVCVLWLKWMDREQRTKSKSLLSQLSRFPDQPVLFPLYYNYSWVTKAYWWLREANTYLTFSVSTQKGSQWACVCGGKHWVYWVSLWASHDTKW